MVNPDPLGSEPFLRAIFAEPEDDAPRMIFADWLEERGSVEWAELIRLECGGTQDVPRRAELISTVWHLGAATSRGFRRIADIVADIAELADPELFRLKALTGYPHWYGTPRLHMATGPIVTPEPLRTILTSPVTQNVTELDLSGAEMGTGPGTVSREYSDVVIEGVVVESSEESSEYRLIDYMQRPVINSPMVEALAGMRECRRLVYLDLRNNDLGNDALRALAQSPYFDRLKTLKLSEGNRFRGRVWQQVLERFGEEVVE